MVGSRTRVNLLKAFSGESQGRNRYLFYMKIAKKEGYEQIAAIFAETADHELSHAKNMFKFLESGEDIEMTATYKAGKIGTTIENLKQSIDSEHKEWTELYKVFSDIAYEEGFVKIGSFFKNVAAVEEGHEKRFRAILERLESGGWFKRDTEVDWMCRKCGYIHIGKTPPELCPACYHPKGYFEEMVKNY